VTFYSLFSVVGTHPDDRGPAGLFDLAGNVAEYTRSLPAAYPYQAEDGRESISTADSRFRAIRGDSPRCADRFIKPVMLFGLSTGFRVVVYAPPTVTGVGSAG
jgi:formylglycine-generating enzyme required for sulfatase activity